MSESVESPPSPPPATVPVRFLPHAVKGLAREKLDREPPAGHDDLRIPIDRGDHALNPGQSFEAFRAGPPRRAAVLVPIVAHGSGATVLFTRRADHLPSHGGQISFPGGKIEGRDKTPLAAALREAHEEIGLEARFVEPLGFLDLYETSSGFRIVPVVALVRPGFELKLDPSEVKAVFEVPLAFLMTASNHRRHSRVFHGLERRYYAMPYGEHYIWGATAGILRNLYERVYR